MRDFVHDLRYGCRNLARTPGFAVAAVLALGLGIGATTAIFSLVNGVILTPLPYHDPHRLVTIWEANGIAPGDPVTLASVGALALSIALISCALPALRAARLNPLKGLRE